MPLSIGRLSRRLQGQPLYIWDYAAPDGARILRFFFARTLIVSHGERGDIRREFSKLREVLHVSVEPNYWSVRWQGESSAQLRIRMLEILGIYQEWDVVERVKMEKIEIADAGAYRALIKKHPRAGWELKNGD